MRAILLAALLAIAPLAAGAQTLGLNTGGPPIATTYAGLPTCNSAYQGGTRVVTDSSVTTPGGAVAAGGSSRVTADCDNGIWRVRGSTGGGGSTNSCDGYVDCVVLSDDDEDGLYAEDFYTAYRALMFPGGTKTDKSVVHLGAPAEQPSSGYILLEDRVRWCNTDTAPTAGDPLSCDATDACDMPTLKLVGDWSKFTISTDWTDAGYPNVWTPNSSGPDAALWFGDQFEDGGTCLTSVDIPLLRIEEVYVDSVPYFSAAPWNAILPLLGDGVTGTIGYMNHDPEIPSGFQGIGAIIAGNDLTVNLDVVQPNGTSYFGAGMTVFGDNVRVAGTNQKSQVSFGQPAEGTHYLTNTSTKSWGGVAYHGTYVYDAQGFDTSIALNNADSISINRPVYGPMSVAKPVLASFTGANNPYPRINFNAPIVTDSTTQSAIRIDTVSSVSVGDPAFPPVLNFNGGLYPNTVEADAGSIVQCGSAGSSGSANPTTTGFSPQLPPSRGCQINLFGAQRAPGGKLQIPSLTTGVTRFQPASLAGEVYAPNERQYETTVSYEAGSANGLCIRNPTSGDGASIGTCDASAVVRAPFPLLISRREIELLSDAPSDSQYRLVMQIEVSPGSNTWLDGRVGPQDCAGANDPHPACTGAGTAVGTKSPASGWLHPHYGEAAHPIHGMSSDDAGEVYHATTIVYLATGQGYRWIFKPISYCDSASGGREDWECTDNDDCDQLTPIVYDGDCDASGAVTGGVNALRVRWAEIPTERESQCYDGMDNDGDSLVDWAASGGDSNCSNRLDDSE